MFLLVNDLSAQSKNSAEIVEHLKKLGVLGSVLYVAAHPDDENTRLITALSKEKHLRTAYVSLTRGDGGQNLIGSELDEFLGTIRTNELMRAREIDGGIQFFTTANDFGYSKTAEETFTIWDKDAVLLDLVRVVRTFKPDVIISRFDLNSTGKTHGHHTASAILAKDAFDHSANPLFHRSDLQNLEPFKVQRLFFNTSWFFWGSREKFEAADKSKLYTLEVGNYLPAYGQSTTEIAALSRSMHKSQGFGINSSRGSMIEYFDRLDQSKETSHSSPFDGLDFSWSRLDGGGNIDMLIQEVIRTFNYDQPHLSIPQLQKVENYIDELRSSYWKIIKLAEVRQIIFECAGLFCESYTDRHIISPGAEIRITHEFILRNPIEGVLNSIHILPEIVDTSFDIKLKTNTGINWSKQIQIPITTTLSSPFWLWNGRENAAYRVDDSNLNIVPTTPKSIQSSFTFTINNRKYSIIKPVIYKNDDPVLGEVKQPLDILPSVLCTDFDPVVILNSLEKKTIHLRLTSSMDNQRGTIQLKSKNNIHVHPNEITFYIKNAGDIFDANFQISTAEINNSITELDAEINNTKLFTHHVIRYAHIPWQNVLIPTRIKVSSIDLKIKNKRISYIEGAGDFTDEALLKCGYKLSYVKADDILNINKKNTDVVIFGVRALNTQESLKNVQASLYKFMNEGGRVIFQYNTTADLVTNEFAPSSLKISRDRVTNEKSKVRIIHPNHPILQTPNKITEKDFEHWVQERGLYFPNPYDSSYTELIAMSDPGDKELTSGILYKKIGKGGFIYTPLSWFRQLPAGVPGAFRLFSNLISF